MKTRKIINALVVLVFGLVMLSSCTTKQGAINNLRSFSYELRDHSQYYDVNDWDKAINKFVKLRDEINKHEYTADERRTIGQIEGECASYMMNGAKDGIINRVSTYTNELQGILEGILGGMGNE
jgi:hypothetical protein